MKSAEPHERWRVALAAGLVALLAGCGGGASVMPEAPEPDPVPTAAQQGFQVGIQLLQAERWQAAETQFRDLIARFPDLPGPHVNLAIAQWRGGQLAAGRQTLEEAVRRFPRFAPASVQLGVLLREQGQFAEADAAYQRALWADPDDPEALYNRGVLNDLYLQRPNVALEMFERYRQVRPDDAAAERHVVELQRRVAAGGA